MTIRRSFSNEQSCKWAKKIPKRKKKICGKIVFFKEHLHIQLQNHFLNSIMIQLSHHLHCHYALYTPRFHQYHLSPFA